MNITYTNTISVEDYNILRQSAGWGDVNFEQAQAGLNGSTFIVAAKDGDKTIGTARLIWDGGNSALIKDMLVLPEYQGKGIGKEMMEQILLYLKTSMKPGWGITVDLMSAIGKEKFYEKFGFVKRPRDRRGAGMDLWITKN
jgi:GNAT superfamily N-acetyltransferase